MRVSPAYETSQNAPVSDAQPCRRKNYLNFSTLDADIGDASPYKPWSAVPHLVQRSSFGVTTLVVLLALTGCGLTNTNEGASASEMFTVEGSVTIAGITHRSSAVEGEACGSMPNSERIDGVRLVLTDDAGATLAVANMPESGAFLESSKSMSVGRCLFNFSFEDAPDGHQFYTIAIGELGEMTYSRDELSGPVDLVFT